MKDCASVASELKSQIAGAAYTQQATLGPYLPPLSTSSALQQFL